MKKLIDIRFPVMVAVAMLLFASCKKTAYQVYDQKFTGIYFLSDSVYYSFGVTPLEKHSYDLKVPVRIMGIASGADRSFSVTVVAEKTTAVEGLHFTIPETFTIMADSINGFVPVTILRDSLKDKDFKLVLKLDKNAGFTPVDENLKEVLIHFNNRVDPPTWKDYWGDPAWPDYKLGKWNPLTYIKFIELFRELEQKVPETYAAMVAEFGPDLQNVTFGWPWDYDLTMTKYVLIPLYQYFMEQHPDLGVTIPRPPGY